MRYSKLFGRTLKEIPAEATLASHRLLHQAGFLRELVAGRYTLLPLGFAVRERVVTIIAEEMRAVDAQQVATPTLHPLELWEQSRRTAAFGDTLMRLTDRRGAAFALGATHEEVMVDLARRFNISYRDLPVTLFQFTTKFRDELRARGGLLRLREFLMKDAYSFHADQASLAETYQAMYGAYTRILQRLDLPAVAVEADSGAIGGKLSHEFIVPADAGEDIVVSCSAACGYAANLERAETQYPPLMVNEPLDDLHEIPAAGLTTIDLMSAAYNRPAFQMLKTVMYRCGEFFIGAVVRGDQEVNEIKLTHVLTEIPALVDSVGEHQLRQATDEEVLNLGTVRGFITPVGLQRANLIWIGDLALPQACNYYTGANRLNVDLGGANYGRDFTVHTLADITTVQEGQPCPRCGQPLRSWRGIEAGHIFALGTRYSAPMGAAYTDQNGVRQPYLMGCYGIGVDRLIGIIAELHHDDRGLVWPASCAPYAIHLLTLGDSPETQSTAESLYARWSQQHVRVLYDDRNAGAGAKFADADIIGVPLRVTVSPRSLEAGGVEMRDRRTGTTRIISVDEAEMWPETSVTELLPELAQRSHSGH